MKATAVLITTESEYPKEVLETLDFDEILIQTECPSIYERYELALKAKNNLIYVQDDDCITDWRTLYESYDGRLTNAITEHHKGFYEDLGMTLVGYGTFFTKDMINFERYLNKYDIDELFLSQADRVFTYLNQPFNSVVVEIKNLPRATESGRMSTTAGHWDNLSAIKRRLTTI